jgi:hypothetical protein
MSTYSVVPETVVEHRNEANYLSLISSQSWFVVQARPFFVGTLVKDGSRFQLRTIWWRL